MIKVLITGSSGMLGKDIFSLFASSKDYIAYGIDKVESDKILLSNQFIGDITDKDFLTTTLNSINPDIIIHCAAIVNLQVCEENKELADSLHIKVTELLSKYNPTKTKFIYISTDSVFDGTKGNYLETDKTNPLNYYAKSKLKGEEKAKNNPNHLIVRTNIFGFNKPLRKSLAEWAITSFNERKEIFGFTNIVFNAIYTKQLAQILLTLIEKNIIGTINIGSINMLSKYSFLKYLGLQISLNNELLKPSISKNLSYDMKRPKNTTLNIDKLLDITDIPTVEEGIEELIKDFFKE